MPELKQKEIHNLPIIDEILANDKGFVIDADGSLLRFNFGDIAGALVDGGNQIDWGGEIGNLNDQLDYLNDVKLPELDQNLANLNDIDLPNLQGQIDQLNNTKLPQLESEIDDLNNIDLPNLQGQIDDLNNTKLPSIEDELTNLSDVKVPNLESSLDQLNNIDLPQLQEDLNHKLSDLPDEIKEVHIADDSISTPKLQAFAVVANKLAAGSVTTAKLYADAVTANKILAGTITSNEVNVTQLIASQVFADQFVANSGYVDSLLANNVFANKITSNEVDVTQLIASQVFADQFVANSGYVGQLITNDVFANKITSNEVDVDQLIASQAWIDQIVANDAYIDVITSNNLWTDKLTANEIGVSSLSALSANIGEVTAGILRDSTNNFVLDLDAGKLTANNFDIETLSNGDHWRTSDNSFQFGGANGIKYSGSGAVGIYSNTNILGNVGVGTNGNVFIDPAGGVPAPSAATQIGLTITEPNLVISASSVTTDKSSLINVSSQPNTVVEVGFTAEQTVDNGDRFYHPYVQVFGLTQTDIDNNNSGTFLKSQDVGNFQTTFFGQDFYLDVNTGSYKYLQVHLYLVGFDIDDDQTEYTVSNITLKYYNGKGVLSQEGLFFRTTPNIVHGIGNGYSFDDSLIVGGGGGTSTTWGSITNNPFDGKIPSDFVQEHTSAIFSGLTVQKTGDSSLLYKQGDGTNAYILYRDQSQNNSFRLFDYYNNSTIFQYDKGTQVFDFEKEVQVNGHAVWNTSNLDVNSGYLEDIDQNLSQNTAVSFDKLKANSTETVSLSTSSNPFQIGPNSGKNLVADFQQIMARNNGTAADIYINQYGGKTYANQLNSGMLSISSLGVAQFDVAGKTISLDSDTNSRNVFEYKQGGNITWTQSLEANGDIRFTPTSGDNFVIDGQLTLPNGEIRDNSDLFWITPHPGEQFRLGSPASGTTIDVYMNRIDTFDILSNEFNVQGKATFERLFADQFTVNIFKPNTIRGMGGEFIFGATSTITGGYEGGGGNFYYVSVDDAVFGLNDNVVISGKDDNGYYDLYGHFSYKSDADTFHIVGRNGTQTSDFSRFQEGDTIVKVDGNPIHVNANASDANTPYIDFYQGLGSFTNGPFDSNPDPTMRLGYGMVAFNSALTGKMGFAGNVNGNLAFAITENEGKLGDAYFDDVSIWSTGNSTGGDKANAEWILDDSGYRMKADTNNINRFRWVDGPIGQGSDNSNLIFDIYAYPRTSSKNRAVLRAQGGANVDSELLLTATTILMQGDTEFNDTATFNYLTEFNNTAHFTDEIHLNYLESNNSISINANTNRQINVSGETVISLNPLGSGAAIYDIVSSGTAGTVSQVILLKNTSDDYPVLVRDAYSGSTGNIFTPNHDNAFTISPRGMFWAHYDQDRDEWQLTQDTGA